MRQLSSHTLRCSMLLSVALFVASCVADLEPVIQPTVDYSTVQGTAVLDAESKKVIIDGVYEVDQDSKWKLFGDVVSVKLAANGELDMYATAGVVYLRLRGGVRSDTGHFAGYWRNVQGPQTGPAYFVVLPDEGGTDLTTGNANPNIVLRGFVAQGGGRLESFVLRRKAQLNDDTKNFQIIAHRGGGRNSERLGVSENTVEMIRLASSLGATGVEIDVQRSRDNVPLVFHDPTFTPRTVRGAYLIGNVSNYNSEEISRLVVLVNGEKIPTLEELLRVVIDETDLTFVWIDMKAPTITNTVLQNIIDANTYARSRNRGVRIVFGIPDDEVLRSFQRSPLRTQVESLCELSAQTTRDIGASIYGQRFTAGVQRTEVEPLRDEGISAYVWTLDNEDFIRSYLSERYKGSSPLYDGILTNYPTLLASRFYVNKYKPK